MVITLGREHGSNGHKVARLLCEKLNIACFDKEIVDAAAENSNFSREILASFDEKRVNTFLGQESQFLGLHEGFRLNMQAAAAQFDTIRAIADKGDCLFVGRCADYVLRKRTDVLRVFILADEDFCIRTLMERYSITADQARKLRKEVNKDRSSFYRYYTDQIWGEAGNYDLCINSGVLGVEGTVEVILSCLSVRGLIADTQ